MEKKYLKILERRQNIGRAQVPKGFSFMDEDRRRVVARAAILKRRRPEMDFGFFAMSRDEWKREVARERKANPGAYSMNKLCEWCGVPVINQNKSGLCQRCRDMQSVAMEK